MSSRAWIALVGALSLVAVPGAEAARQDVLIRGATVVTMNAKHRVIPNGRVLVSGSKIAAVWGPSDRPRGLSGRRLRRATAVQAKRDAYLFPGLINLHDHPSYGVLHAWPAPSSQAIPARGKAGTDPYDNRYEWNEERPDELERLVENPASTLQESRALGLYGEAVK